MKAGAIAAVALLAATTGAARADGPAPAPVPEAKPGFVQGYLPREALPDSVAILPPPPAVGSAADALDREVARTSFALRGSARWTLAAMDADLAFPAAAGTYSCALGAPVTEADTPTLYLLLRRVLADAGSSTFAAKQKYRKARPFMVDVEPICTPDREDDLRRSGAYPSGHSALGWAWALVLAEAAPERATAVLARGLAYGESRIVCNVHWASDVAEGRIVGAATVARLHDDPAFLRDLEAAKAELKSVRERSLPPQRDCAFEAEALAIRPPR